MNLRNKLYILVFFVLYAVVNYVGYVYKFEFVSNQLAFIKDSSEFTNRFDKVITAFPTIEYNDWYSFLVSLNLHIYVLCVIIQYEMSIKLNGKNGIKVLIFSLVFIFVIRHLSKQLSFSNNHLLRWIGLNTFTRSLKVYTFLLYFPSMPFLIFIINKSIADKVIKKNK